ncbi:MAG: hypothetical protein KA383_11420 [Phycisphaerae bacterium]|nr:hypothetical protein [Phycisphaerae bacterium]
MARTMVVIVLAAWAFSWSWVIGYGDTGAWCALGHGRVTVVHHRHPGEPSVGFCAWLRPIGPTWEAAAKRNDPDATPWRRMGLTLPGMDWYAFDVPLWLLLLFFAAAAWALKPKRIVPGHCTGCGYDLTGNVSGRCPECGTATPTVPDDAKPTA